mgnify:CR=1 FL=1
MSHSEDYLERTEPPKAHRHLRRRRLRIFSVTLFVLMIFWSAAVVVSGVQVFAHTLDARDDLMIAADQAKQLDAA